MKIAIVGSREFPEIERVQMLMTTFPPETVIISGGASGVDEEAESYARHAGLEVEIFLPDWYRYGRFAGPRRNLQMVQAADVIYAFWDGESKGTKWTIDYALKEKKELHVFLPRGKA